MSEKRVDARGLPCPRPVVLALEAMAADGVDRVSVVVDNDAAVENVKRAAGSRGWAAQVEGDGGERVVVLTKGGVAPTPAPLVACDCAAPSDGGVVVFVASEFVGTGDERLGRLLMKAFLSTLPEVEPRPSSLVFVNSGVKLTTEGSEVVGALSALEAAGAEVLSCGTCLDYYGLADSLRVGRASNMYEIASTLLGAGRVVRP